MDIYFHTTMVVVRQISHPMLLIFTAIFVFSCSAKLPVGIEDKTVLSQMVKVDNVYNNDDDLKVYSIKVKDKIIPVNTVHFTSTNHLVVDLRDNKGVNLCTPDSVYIFDKRHSFDYLFGVETLKTATAINLVTIGFASAMTRERYILVLDDSFTPSFYVDDNIKSIGQLLFIESQNGKVDIIEKFANTLIRLYLSAGTYKRIELPIDGCSSSIISAVSRLTMLDGNIIFPYLCVKEKGILIKSYPYEILFFSIDPNLERYSLIGKAQGPSGGNEISGIIPIGNSGRFIVVHAQISLSQNRTYTFIETDLSSGQSTKILELEDRAIPVDIKFSDNGRYMALITFKPKKFTLTPQIFIQIFDLFTGKETYVGHINNLEPFKIKAIGFYNDSLIFLSEDKLLVIDANSGRKASVDILKGISIEKSGFNRVCLADIAVSRDEKWIALPYGPNLIVVNTRYLENLLENNHEGGFK